VIQFALRHPDPTTGPILLGSSLPGKAGRPPKPVAQLLFGSDLVFWTLKAWLPSLYARLPGMPKGFRPTAEEQRTILQAQESLFPIPPRKQGVLFDLYVSNCSAVTAGSARRSHGSSLATASASQPARARDRASATSWQPSCQARCWSCGFSPRADRRLGLPSK
jgi:hypothetical protein